MADLKKIESLLSEYAKGHRAEDRYTAEELINLLSDLHEEYLKKEGKLKYIKSLLSLGSIANPMIANVIDSKER